MASTLNQITYGILEQLRTKITDDEPISVRQLEQEVAITRAHRLTNKFNKANVFPSDQEYQNLECFEFELTDLNCCENCTELISKKEIPDMIETRSGYMWEIRPLSYLHPKINVVDFNRMPYIGNGVFNKNQIYAALYKKKVLLASNQKSANLITKLNLRGVFADPSDLLNYSNCSSDPCFSADKAYPLTDSDVKVIQDIIVDRWFNIYNKLNDTQDAQNYGEYDTQGSGRGRS